MRYLLAGCPGNIEDVFCSRDRWSRRFPTPPHRGSAGRGYRGSLREAPTTSCLPAVFLAGPPKAGLPAMVHLVAGGVGAIRVGRGSIKSSMHPF
jgi:hypothetical protein